ncbi:hypothetical protein H072_7252 [Dactylellina haptotyla CBS 200.50]|uniref:Uncharacterized protein n=1 Tax=Dactylellina haptotyla (strain CBS 200.50) TaxID=1284197 RepID=S8ACZ7_DACHA|nr:hypothetical protein H072_7252 [Dactylellina haptotyla CBS 200.50]
MERETVSFSTKSDEASSTTQPRISTPTLLQRKASKAILGNLSPHLFEPKSKHESMPSRSGDQPPTLSKAKLYAVNNAGRFRPPSSLATPKSRDPSPTVFRARTPTNNPLRTQKSGAPTVTVNILRVGPPRQDAQSTTSIYSPGSVFQGENYDSNAQLYQNMAFNGIEITDKKNPTVKPKERSPAPPSSPPPKINFEEENFEEIWSPTPFYESEDSVVKTKKSVEPVTYLNVSVPQAPRTPENGDIATSAGVLKNPNQPWLNYLGDPDRIESDLNDAILDENPWTRKPLAFFSNKIVSDTYRSLNFEYRDYLCPIIEVSDIFLPRTLYCERILPEDRDAWFKPPTSGQTCMIEQQWCHCKEDDARVLRDLYCGYNLQLHKTIQEASRRTSRCDTWVDVWVDPCNFVTSLYQNFQCSIDVVERLWDEHGIDFFKFVELQYELRSAPYSYKPNAIDLTTASNHRLGQKTYILSFQKLSEGRFKLRRFPPHITTACSVSPRDSGFECIIMPDIWHPHHSASKGFTLPKYSATPENSWLQWDSNMNCFRGRIPNSRSSVNSVLEDGRMCITIRGGYTLDVGSSKIDFAEAITTRIYIRVPETPRANPPVHQYSSQNYSYSLDLDSVFWGSQKLGLTKKHADFVVNKARMYKERLEEGYDDADAKRYMETGEFPWDTRFAPKIKSLGYVTWTDFINHKRQQKEHHRSILHYGGTSENDVRYGPTEWDSGDINVDESLEEMRIAYENILQEADVIIWVNTQYRETMQERLIDEALEDIDNYQSGLEV